MYGLQFAWQGQFQPVQPRTAVLMQFKFRETASVFMVPCVHLARVYVLLSANDEKELNRHTTLTKIRGSVES